MGMPQEDAVRPWPWWLALVALAAAFLAIIAAGVLFAAVGGLLGSADDLLDDYDYAFGLIQDVLWIAVAIGSPSPSCTGSAPNTWACAAATSASQR